MLTTPLRTYITLKQSIAGIKAGSDPIIVELHDGTPLVRGSISTHITSFKISNSEWDQDVLKEKLEEYGECYCVNCTVHHLDNYQVWVIGLI